MPPFHPVDFESKATSLAGLEVSDLPFVGKGIYKEVSVKPQIAQGKARY
jgi:hypothetical protein